ncbi:unnamed protein product [Ectocarpus sp. 12 AP-2014]
MVSSSGVATIDTILDNARCDHIRVQPAATPAGSCQFGRSRTLLRKAWDILNKWALEILVHRGTVDVPNFMRVGWQRFQTLDGEMRLRPVFILNEGFCRAHDLPHKRILRPPLFRKAAEAVNYSKLAIRYTTFMTKDMVYGALREVFRGIGDAMSSGGQVSVVFSFGTLEVKERKFHFTFDCAALCRNGSTTTRTDTSSSCGGEHEEREEWDGFSTGRSRSSSGLPPRPPAGSGLGARHGSDDGHHRHDDDHPTNAEPPPGTPCPGASERDGWNQTPTDDDGGGRRRCPGGGVLGKKFDEEVERQRAQEVAAEWGRKRGSGKRCRTREKASRSPTRLVWESAFRDHVTALEGLAEDDMNLANRTRLLQLAEDRRKSEERENKQREMHDLLTFVQGQIHAEIEDRRALEVESKRNGDKPLTFSARRDRASTLTEKYRGTAWRAPDWGPRRARASNITRDELLGCLQRQIREREEERVRGNRRRLVEEKAAVEKLDRDYDAKEARKKAEREVAQMELKRSWEVHGQIKRMRALAKVGPAALRNYALSQDIIEQDGKNDSSEGRARTGWTEPGPRAITGPSKLYMKGVCRYRPWVDVSEEGRRVNGNDSRDGGGGSDRPIAEDAGSRRPSTALSETPSSVGFDSRLSAQHVH